MSTPSPSPKHTVQITTLPYEGAPEESVAGHAGDTRPQQAAGSMRTGSSLPSHFPCRFGRYELKKQIGQGGMGAVYLAHDTHLDRDVALKIPLFVGASAEAMRERFFREARSAAMIDHPNICPIHELGETDGIHYLTMAYIEGQPLSKFIHKDKPQPERGVAQLVKQVAEAMAEAHSLGIIHRDLKPANIMINKRKQPIVMDFGLARRGGSEDARLTSSGAMMGTPSYMPPEQVNGDVAAMGPTSDIYSLGVILFELLTGRVPFDGKFGELMSKILYEPPAPLSRFRPDLTPKLEAICLKALQKRPADRYLSMRAFADELADYLSTAEMVPVAAPVVGGASGARESSLFSSMVDEIEEAAEEEAKPVAAKRRTNPWMWIAGSVFALLIVTFGVVLLIRTEDGEVQIELSEPNANVEISVDGNVITLKSPTDTFKIKAGPHKLEVRGTSFETITESFSVKSGNKEIVRVTLKPKVVAKKKTPNPDFLPAASLQPESVLAYDFREIHGADLQAMKDWLGKCQTDGWTPSELSVQIGCEKPRFDGIAVRDGNPLPFEFWNKKRSVSLDSIDSTWRDRQLQGHLQVTYPTAEGLNELFILRRDEDRRYPFYFNPMNSVQKWIEQQKKAGLRVYSLRGFRDENNVLYEARHLPAAGVKSQEAFDLTAGELRSTVDKLSKQKWRIETLSAYDDAAGNVRYLAVFVENRDGPDYWIHYDLKPDEFEKELAAKRAAGFRPLSIVSHGKKAETRYTVAWLKMAASPHVPTDGERVTVETLLKKARDLFRDNKWKELEAECTAALKIDPRNAELLQLRFDARRNDGFRWGPAIADITQALRWKPDDAKIRTDRSWAYMQIAQFELCIRDADEVLKREPKTSLYYRNAFNVKAWSLAKVGAIDAALKLFDEGIGLWPKDAEFLAGRAAIHDLRGDDKLAREDREKAKTIDPLVAGRDWSLKSAQPDDARAFDFREIHNADLKDLEKWYEQMRKEGASPCSLSQHLGGPEHSFNAVAVFDGNPLPIRLHIYRSPAERRSILFGNAWRTRQHENFVFDGDKLEGLLVAQADEDRPSSLWTGKNDFIQSKLDETRRNRWRPLALRRLECAKDFHQMIVAPDEGIVWKEHMGLTADELRTVFQRAALNRRRPDLLSVYLDEKGVVRYTTVLIDNRGGPTWSVDLGLTAADYEEKLKEQSEKRIRPHALISWRDKDNLCYGCVWLKMAAVPEKASPENQATAEKHLVEALRWYDSKDWKRVDAECTEALNFDPISREAHWHRYWARSWQGRWAYAVADLSEILRRDPKDVEALEKRSWAIRGLKEYERALEDADAGIKLAVPNSFTHILLLRGKGWTFAMSGELEKGLVVYNEAALRSPIDAGVYFERSSIHDALGNTAEAKADLAKAIELDPIYKTKETIKLPKKSMPK